jgi:hypothetical protein
MALLARGRTPGTFTGSRRFQGCRRIALVLVALAVLAHPGWGQELPGTAHLQVLEQLPPELRGQAGVRLDLTVLFTAYRDYCQAVEVDKNGKLYLVMRDKTRIIYDDGRSKTFEEKLAHPDLEDMLSQLYPLGEPAPDFRPDYDPGRFRVTAFFNAVYGGSAAQVKRQMTPVPFTGQTVQFNGRNGAAAALAKVGAQLAELIRREPDLRRYLFPLGGCFAWRVIAGTERLSPHSWAAAIDLNPQQGAYWRWQKNSSAAAIIQLRRSYPYKIVKIFEAAGFIWGGKWSHYDLMHFEYRPELLLKSRLAGAAP